MDVTVNKWGNALGVRFPLAFVKEIGLKKGEKIRMTLDNGKIIIEPAIKSHHTWEKMVDSIPQDSRGGEVRWGEDVGKEIIP